MAKSAPSPHRAMALPLRARRKVYGPPKKGELWSFHRHPDTRLRAGHHLFSVALKDVLDREVTSLKQFAPDECELVTNYKHWR